ncbi:hypothetical protein DL546_007188 [Coniochaeta pulveracea]|uniref:SMP-30/Gluconolactonase/LRE-like region domain-containing protein n=1 Tax=Coniochaeta pulveracea TaxID=177199 RepID=A0A420YJJ1_9PEZI|nr:hypothetical protein DL546_007188 [Coniochaeta pulveracea]
MSSENLQTWETGKPWLDIHCKLGEGPFFEKATNTLRFVDIINKKLHTVSLTDGPGSLRTQSFPEAVTVTANIEGVDPREKILVGVKQGIAVLDRKTGQYEYVTKFEEAGDAYGERIRSNDGATDPHGRFWLGTMTDFPAGDPQAEGALFRFDLGKRVGDLKTNLTIPNSIGWSPDGRTMYFTHTTTQQVLAWDYDPKTGEHSNERVFYQHHGPGSPDGFRVDVDGNIWHAFYGGACVLKISPEGKLMGKINLPTKNVTCPEFVGTELWITTAADDQGEEEESRKYGGGLFKVDVGTRGLPHTDFKLAA